MVDKLEWNIELNHHKSDHHKNYKTVKSDEKKVCWYDVDTVKESQKNETNMYNRKLWTDNARDETTHKTRCRENNKMKEKK